MLGAGLRTACPTSWPRRRAGDRSPILFLGERIPAPKGSEG